MVLTFRSSLCDLLGNFVSLVSYANRAHKGDIPDNFDIKGAAKNILNNEQVTH